MGHAIPTAVLNKKMTGIHLPTVPFNRLFRALSFAFSLGIGLVRKRHDVDVILASVLGESALVAACFKRARILKQPLIVRTAGAGSTGDAAGLQRLPLTFLLIRLINQTCDAILILSPKIAKELAGLRINPDLFIPTACGVPLGKMQSLKKKEQEPLRFVFVGRLRYEKGIGYLLRALRHLAEKGHDLHLDLVGDGPQMAALKALARSLSLETRVFFHGQLPPDRVNLFFRGDTVFVLPSLNEGQPNALLEAMAAGCPAIVTRSGGAEYLVDDTTGLVCPAADSRALAMAMETMIALGAGKRRAMGQAAKARIQEKHAMQLIGDRYLSLFKRLLTAESVERANP
jgi:glycosyltransferase involved in cell wall biosynthesis